VEEEKGGKVFKTCIDFKNQKVEGKEKPFLNSLPVWERGKGRKDA